MTDPTPPSRRVTLRELPLAARLVLTIFLCTAGLSYLAGLNQIHFQLAPAGEAMPGLEDVKDAYHGKPQTSMVARLVKADESKAFNGAGTMRPAFTTKSLGWKRVVRDRKSADNVELAEAEKRVRADREAEIKALLAWIDAGGKKDNYKAFPVPAGLQNDELMQRQPDGFFTKEGDHWQADVSAIMESRCARCHSPAAASPAGEIHVDTHEALSDYLEPEKHGGGMSLRALAQTTHIHLPSFAMLFGLTGLILAFSSYPALVRVILCPWPMLALVADVGSWWLIRADPAYAALTLGLGGLAAVGILLQVVLGVFDMYGWGGKGAWLLVLLMALAGGYAAKVKVIDRYLAIEKTNPSIRE